MDWFITIFSNQGDKARLVTTLIAAFIAVSVVLLNQWFNSRRSKNEKYRDKIEEMFTAVIETGELASDVYAHIVNNYSKYKRELGKTSGMFLDHESPTKALEEMNDNFYRINSKAYMLSSLYFPELKTDLKKHEESYHAVYSFVESESFNDYIDDCEISIKEMRGSIETILDKLSLIMKKELD